jgi:hypothetical protein
MTPQTTDFLYPEIPPREFGSFALDKGFQWVTRLFAFGVVAVLIYIAVVVGIDAVPAMKQFGWDFLVSSAWNPVENDYGALPMIFGTFASSLIALLIAVPIGVGTAIFLSENFLPPSIRLTLNFLVELLAAIPSVVYGLWGIYVLIPFLKPMGTWLYTHLGWFPLFSSRYLGPGLLPAASGPNGDDSAADLLYLAGFPGGFTPHPAPGGSGHGGNSLDGHLPSSAPRRGVWHCGRGHAGPGSSHGRNHGRDHADWQFQRFESFHPGSGQYHCLVTGQSICRGQRSANLSVDVRRADSLRHDPGGEHPG